MYLHCCDLKIVGIKIIFNYNNYIYIYAGIFINLEKNLKKNVKIEKVNLSLRLSKIVLSNNY